MVSDDLPCHAGRVTPAMVAELNRSPLTVLAECGMRHGATFSRAFIHAQQLVEIHGTSRSVDAGQAAKLCAAMRTWAESRRTA